MYDHLEVEKKWHKYWDEHETFKTDVWAFSKPKFRADDTPPFAFVNTLIRESSAACISAIDNDPSAEPSSTQITSISGKV